MLGYAKVGKTLNFSCLTETVFLPFAHPLRVRLHLPFRPQHSSLVSGLSQQQPTGSKIKPLGAFLIDYQIGRIRELKTWSKRKA